MKTFFKTGLLCILMTALSSAQLQVADSTNNTLVDAPRNEINSFMGMTVGSEIRAKCTDPAVDLNHARLLAVSLTYIIVTTSGQDKLVLPEKKPRWGRR